MPNVTELQESIVEVLHQVKAYNLPAECLALGLDPGDESEANRSKKVYVRKRLAGKPQNFLLELANKVLERYLSERLDNILKTFGTSQGVEGEVKNLIFAANGPKPELVLTDSVGNNIAIVKNSEFCLVYDLPIPQNGLLWENLVEWWAKKNNLSFPNDETESSLLKRLRESLASEVRRNGCC